MFTVTVRAEGTSNATQLKFELSNCNSCTLSPPAGTVFAFNGDVQTYQLTINGNQSQDNVVLTVSYGNGFNKSMDAAAFSVQYIATPTKLRVDAPPTASVGASFNVTVTALNNSDQLVSGFNNQVTVTSDDPAKTSLGPVTLTNGTGSFSTSLPTVRTTTITATYAAITGTDTIQIMPGPATRFEVVAQSAVNAGTQFPVTINARDTSGNLATGFSGTVTLTSTDPAASSLGSVTVTNGTGTLTTAVLKTVGSRTITGTAGSVTGTSGTILVSAGQAVTLAVAPSVTTVAAGSAFSIQVTAQDLYGNTVTNFGPTITLSSTDTQATGMGNVTLNNGTGSFQTTLGTGGPQTITAGGVTMPGITGSATVTVTAAAATHFVVSAPQTATAGTQFNFTVTARDQFRNLVPIYAGTVRFTSSDGQAILPPNATLSQGTAMFPATLKTAGSQTITATDTASSSITGASDKIAVAAAALSQFELTAPTNTNSGTSFAAQITAKDVYFNTLTSYSGPANISSSDSQAIIPASVAFASGIASFQATLKTAGSQTLVATDQANSAITATKQINVAAASATRIEISAVPGTATAGQPFSLTVTAKDQSGNLAAGFAGTLTFTSSDAAAVPPANSGLTSGTGTFQATLKTVGSWTITATDTSNASITATSTAIVVAPGPLHHFLFTVAPTEIIAGQPTSLTVTAKDQFNNTVTSYAGPVTITSNDPTLSVRPEITFSAGVATGQGTLQTAGTRTLTVTSSTMPPVSEQVSILVKPSVPDRIEIVSGNEQSVRISTVFSPLVVRVIDPYDNPIPNWQITFAGPTSGASLVFSPSATVRTGDNGQASVNGTANQVAGSYQVQVVASPKPEGLRTRQFVPFTLTNQAGPPADVQATGGSVQSTQAGTPFPLPLIVTVRDSAGNALSNVDVTLTVPTSGASAVLTPSGPYRTDVSGRVSVNAVANAVTGSFSVTATVTGAESVPFQLANLAVPPGSLTITRGSEQSARVNSAFGVPLEVLVRDASGIPANDAAVVFLATGSGASANLSAETARTTSSGTASVTATANARAGSYQVTVVASTGGSGIFNLTNSPAAPAKIEAVGGALQSARVDSYFAQPLRVRVVDQFGNGVPDATVAFEPPGTGASAVLSATSATTNAQGYTGVTALANTAAGSYFVNARVVGVSSPAAFSLSNLAGQTGSIVASAGSQQSVIVASVFPQLLQVTVRDGYNNPIPNANVVFSVPSTGASATLSALSALTDANGNASVRGTANTTAGTYQVEAAAPGIPAATVAVFTLTNRAGPVSAISATPDATPQSTRINVPFPAALRVRVADSNGNPIEGVAVTYAAPGSGQSAQLSSTTNVTDAQGQAAVTAVANSIAGSYIVSASIAGAGPATFTLTNIAGAPATIEIISGNEQVATAGSLFAPLIVRVRDGGGNLLSGQALTFSSPGSGPSAAAASTSISTDSSGQASFIATANTLVGRYPVVITGSGVASPAVFFLTNRAGTASRIIVLAGSNQLAFVGRQFGIPLRVLVQDTYGNPAGGAAVSFAPPPTGASALLSSLSDITGPNGQASVSAIAGGIAGAYAVTATAAGGAGSASFNLTNIAATGGVISVTSGPTQSAPVSTTFVFPLTVRLLDPRGNPVVGATVTFTVPASGASASLSQSTKTTDSQGFVSVVAVANQTAGSYQVAATAPDFTGTAVFNLTNTPVSQADPIVIAIVNAASFTAGAAPGSLQTIFGNNLASTTETATGTPLPVSLGGISVSVAGRQVPLLYASPRQINFQLPPEATPGRVEVVVLRGVNTVARAPLSIDPSAPGIFLQIASDIRRAAALNTDYTLNLPLRPAPAGGYVLLFMTGIGSVTPSIAAGEVAPLSPLSVSQMSKSAIIGPRPVNVQFAGKAPTSLGDQVNLQIPPDLPPGEYSVAVTVNGVQSNPAIISVGPAVPSR